MRRDAAPTGLEATLSMQALGKSSFEAPLNTPILTSATSDIAIMAGIDGLERLYAFAPLRQGDRGNVYIAVGIPTGITLAAADRGFASSLLLHGAAVLLALAGAWVGSLHYQPKAELASGRACGTEALARWQHPRRSLVPPDEFISLAEHTGLVENQTMHDRLAALACDVAHGYFFSKPLPADKLDAWWEQYARRAPVRRIAARGRRR